MLRNTLLAAAAVFTLSYGAAQALVVGSSVTCTVVNGGAFGGGEPNCDPGPYAIQADGPTISLNGNGTVPSLLVEFTGGMVEINTAPGLGAIGFVDEILQLSGFIDSSGGSLFIDNFSDTLADPDFESSDVTILSGVLSVDLSGVIWLGGESASFEIASTGMSAVPLPPSALLMLSAIAGLGFGLRRRKKTGIVA